MSTDERFLSPQYYPDIQLRGIARNRYQGEHTLRQEARSKQWTPRWSTGVNNDYRLRTARRICSEQSSRRASVARRFHILSQGVMA
ncbi:hypothetical protein OK016_18380 [Vibrio chagasii]|nr:hypothetical protein [Vibrio chagasii]